MSSNITMNPATAAIVEASLLNNEGAVLYAKGKWSQALAKFRRSLESFVEFLTVEPSQPPLLNEQLIPSSAIAALHLSRLFSDHTDVSSQPFTGSDAPFLFESPIVFEEIISQDQHQEANQVFCGVVTFNLAIASHAKAKATGDANVLVKALQLYDSCVNFFYQAPQHGTVYVGIVSAALNNKICIFFENGRFEELEEDKEKLSNVMIVASQHASTRSFLNDHQYEGVLMNLLLLHRPVTADAA